RNLMGRPGLREVVRQRRGRSHGIEQGRPGNPVIPMVEVVLPEENRSGVMATDNIGTERTPPLHQGAPEVEGIGELAVGEAEVLDAGKANEGGRRLELRGAL